MVNKIWTSIMIICIIVCLADMYLVDMPHIYGNWTSVIGSIMVCISINMPLDDYEQSRKTQTEKGE